MFKKIEIWTLYLALLLGIPLIIGFGFLVRQELVGTIKLGFLSETALFLSKIPVKIKAATRSDFMLEDKFPLLGGFNGNPNSHGSFLLLSRYDGNSGEGIVELVDLLNFKVLHT